MVYFARQSPRSQIESAVDLYASTSAREQFLSRGYSVELVGDLSGWQRFDADFFFGHDKPTPSIHAGMHAMGIHMVSLCRMWSRPYSLLLCQEHNLPVVPWVRFSNSQKAKEFWHQYEWVIIKQSYKRCKHTAVGILGNLPSRLMDEDTVLMAACRSNRDVYLIYIFDGNIISSRMSGDADCHTYRLDKELELSICALSRSLTRKHGAFLSSLNMMIWDGKPHVIELNPSSVGVCGFHAASESSIKLRDAMINYMDDISRKEDKRHE